ncbi:MAG TPA: hypothetical protein VK013_09795 [Myxococcaceae bacterium]|nr:hypothetical protein [Myxococcaceae bacterium]
MAVRTPVAGMKMRRPVGIEAAMPQQHKSGGRPTPFSDEARRAQIEANRARAVAGPAAEPPQPDRNRRAVSISGRKKAPSQMHIKRKGGPFERSRLHGG